MKTTTLIWKTTNQQIPDVKKSVIWIDRWNTAHFGFVYNHYDVDDASFYDWVTDMDFTQHTNDVLYWAYLDVYNITKDNIA